MNKIKPCLNHVLYRIPIISFCLIGIWLTPFMAGCQNPTESDELNVDHDIPLSEKFNASYGFWGPEGTTIYFQHSEKLGSDPNPGKLDQLWELNLETGQREKIRNGRILNADISPDGEWFVFQTFFPPQYLYKMRSDGTDLQKLTGPDSPNSNLRHTVLGRWSPDGKRILYSVAGVPRGIALMDSSGANSNIIVPFGIQPNWSPGGTNILYANFDTTRAKQHQEQIYIANSDGSNPMQLTDLKNTLFNIQDPSLSPNAEKIVFIHDGEVHIMMANGDDVDQVTEGTGYTARPEWSPDGQTILFSRIILNGPKRLYYLDVASREVTPVFPGSLTN